MPMAGNTNHSIEIMTYWDGSNIQAYLDQEFVEGFVERKSKDNRNTP